jgi:hypothetical protein
MWLFVLIADAVATGSATAVVYLFAGVVAITLAFVGAGTTAGQGARLTPQPVRVRAEFDRRR